MLRPITNLATKSSLRATVSSARGISYTVARMGEGDTGGTRSGGSASSDAFTKRENASEAMYVREKELQKLKTLQATISEHKKNLDELDKKVKEQMGQGENKKS